MMLDATTTVLEVLPDEPELVPTQDQPFEGEPDGETGGRADRYLAEADTGDAPWWSGQLEGGRTDE